MIIGEILSSEQKHLWNNNENIQSIHYLDTCYFISIIIFVKMNHFTVKIVESDIYKNTNITKSLKIYNIQKLAQQFQIL